MGRIKKFREESEVVSFRIPKIDDLEERKFFKDTITKIIEELQWIRYSWNFRNKETIYPGFPSCNISKEEYFRLFKRNIKVSVRNYKKDLWNFI